jgi:PIN domain nuclease of toxin-antitoxin system
MKLLLDTQALLWFLTNDARLSRTAKSAIESVANQSHVSLASLWEIVIKVSLGKLRLPARFADIFPAQLRQNGFVLMPVELRHLGTLESLPYHHRDPFDRLLIAQAQTDGFTVVTNDPAFPPTCPTRFGRDAS